MNTIGTPTIIDIRDIIARVEELEPLISTAPDPEDHEEYVVLTDVLTAMAGKGGDEQWRGDWYPIIVIRDDHFEDYARELAEDIGAIQPDMRWPYTCIDWEKAARELRYDYSAIEFDDTTYWYR